MKHIVVVDSDLEELIPGFINKRQEDICAILAAAQTRDYETIRIIGHTLKGIGGGYGFDAITELGAAIEQSGKLKDLAKAQKLAQAMKEYLETVEVHYE